MSRLLVIGCGGVASVAIRKCCQNSDVFYRDYDRKAGQKEKMRCTQKRRLKSTTKDKN